MTKATCFLRRNIGRPIVILALLLLFLFLGTWLGRLVPAERAWSLTDLRWLEDASAPDPAAVITAIFTRPAGTRCEIRLDFLELTDPPQYDFALTLDGQTTVFSSASPPPRGIHLKADPVTDSLTLSLSDCRPSTEAPLIIETAAQRLETTFGAQLDMQPVRLRFVFSNTFSPAATPIQALRRWDGAHSGPRGERHGLHGLLAAAERYGVPLTLYDTRTRVALSAIDAVGGTEQLRRMEAAGLLARPTGPAPSLPLLRFEIDHNGLPLEARRALLTSVSPTSSVSPPVLVGGDLQRSTWGTYEYAAPAFAWLAARPYFMFEAPALPTPEEQDGTDQPIAASIAEVKTMLAQSDPALAQNYAGLLPALEAAAHWAENPTPIAECQTLCALASDRFYAVLNPDGGRLVLLFAGQQQIIGPTAQFFIGLSDRSQWDLSKGEAADPAQVMGAFADADAALRPYQAEITGNTLRFVAADGREKTYRLTESGLQAVFSAPFETDIPLALAPQTRFRPGWASRYRLERLPDGIRLGVDGGPLVTIQVQAGEVRAADSFLDTIPVLASPEDPNRELSPGFFLPFPMTIVHLSASQVSITVQP